MEKEVSYLTLQRAVGCMALLALASACAGDRAGSPLPDELHGLELIEQQSGEEATNAIAQLHEQDVAPTESYIGRYGTEEIGATIYVSRFASADEAQSQLVSMAEGIGEGAAGYGHHRTLEVDGREVHVVFGRGEVHFFYVDGNDLTWLGAHPMFASLALADLLSVSPESIPSLMPAMPPVSEETKGSG
jgi:hypothetical protein